MKFVKTKSLLVIKLVRTQEQMLQVDICTFILHIGFPLGFLERLDSYFSGDMLYG